MDKRLSTEPYKGTRDFYPEDMAIQRYIFDTWAKTAESFGYERYDASILEPSELYKSKGAENEELVNEQTYTFTDRGDREVTLRPEMTPTVARMIAAKRRELSFPVRWYSIPNLFRYERPQRGRLREHWQLNCDMFLPRQAGGSSDIAADVEMVALAYNVLTSFGATSDMFEIRINDRALMQAWYKTNFNLNDDQISEVTRIVDRKKKVSSDEFKILISKIVPDVDKLIQGLESKSPNDLVGDTQLGAVIDGLTKLGITNVIFDATIARGFDYYTGTIFEALDVKDDNKRSLLGGGRYDNLTGLFDGEPVSGIGFGMGDVTVRDFLETHGLLEGKVPKTAPTLSVLPMDVSFNLEGERIAQDFRNTGTRTAVDMSDKKIGKKISAASETGVEYILVVGADEIASQKYTLKKLSDGSEQTTTIDELTKTLG